MGAADEILNDAWHKAEKEFEESKRAHNYILMRDACEKAWGGDCSSCKRFLTKDGRYAPSQEPQG